MANSGKQWLAVHDDLRKTQKDRDKKKKKPEEKPKKNQGGGLLGNAIRGLRNRRRTLEDL